MLLEYKRTFLPRSNMLSGDFTLEADKLENGLIHGASK